MRYYIEAFDKNNRHILGNLDGQAALGAKRFPWRTKAWKLLHQTPPGRPIWPRVVEWRLVDETGKALRFYKNPHKA